MISAGLLYRDNIEYRRSRFNISNVNKATVQCPLIHIYSFIRQSNVYFVSWIHNHIPISKDIVFIYPIPEYPFGLFKLFFQYITIHSPPTQKEAMTIIYM